MKEALVDGQRAVIAHDESAEVAEPGEGAFHDPPSLVAAQGSSVLRRRPAPILPMRGDQLDAARRQLLTQRIAIVAAIGDQAERLLPRATGVMPTPYADRRERRRDEPDLRRGCSLKVVSQRNTRAVDHHHPLRALAPLGLSDSAAPFFAGAKLPSRNDSLHSSCRRSFNSLRNARQMFNQTRCSSQSRSRRQLSEVVKLRLQMLVLRADSCIEGSLFIRQFLL